MVKNHLKNYCRRIQIRIFINIESKSKILPCHTPNLSTTFHSYPSTTFWDILHTNKQTNKQEEDVMQSTILAKSMNKFKLKINLWLNSMTKYATPLQISIIRMKIDNFWNLAYVILLAYNITSKIIGGWGQWPDMQILFKLQVNDLKIEDFRNLP